MKTKDRKLLEQFDNYYKKIAREGRTKAKSIRQAAPDLLEALQFAIIEIRSNPNHDKKLLNMLNAAVNKAERGK